ncbi:MAG TPA: sugar transferase [Caulobacteraceae bacterium]|jgi:putative colanic acid biosynthesis UDP-glucose lipid carrier transferase|nr:sugar transferase [Caulobacteraceae bacterium]
MSSDSELTATMSPTRLKDAHIDRAKSPVDSARIAMDAGTLRLRQSRCKRLIDIAGALTGLLFLSPFLVIVATMICIDSPGPVFFRQRRTGRDGVPFLIYKFRTMRVLEDGAKVVQASKKDSRVTRVGKFLRRSSIDELPQLLNVLKNEMSLVGPRPHALAHDEYYALTVPSYNDRFRTKPGITGLAQVSGLRGEVIEVAAMAARIQRDVEYICDWSIVRDLEILARTFMMGPYQPGAY